MLQLNVVHLDTKNILIFNNLYIIHDNFRKKWWQDMLNLYLLTTRDWLIGCFRMARLCYSRRFEKTLINVAEPYFLPLNRALNIITMKAKVLSPNPWCKCVALCSWKSEYYSQIRSNLSVLLSEKKLYWILNRLEDLLALNICAQNFSVSEIKMEGFKIEQSRTK